jgi:hypothetical protein
MAWRVLSPAVAMGVREVTVRSLGELLDRVTPERPDPSSGRRRDVSLYRGAAHPELPLLTSLDRLGGVDPPHTKRSLEGHVFRNFVRYSRPYPQHAQASEWELLVVARHYGLPTRLLDWSFSPLVAAHFATVAPPPPGERLRARAVWRLDWKAMHRRFELPELALMPRDLDRVLREVGGIESLGDLFAHDRAPRRDFACMFEPPSLEARLIAQAAAFTICSDRTRAFDSFLASVGLADALTRFVVPAEHVATVRDQLDIAAVDERHLFPDLGGLASQLRRWYSASGEIEPS